MFDWVFFFMQFYSCVSSYINVIIKKILEKILQKYYSICYIVSVKLLSLTSTMMLCLVFSCRSYWMPVALAGCALIWLVQKPPNHQKRVLSLLCTWHCSHLEPQSLMGSLSLTKKLSPGEGVRPVLRTTVKWIKFNWCELKLFYCTKPSCLHIKDNKWTSKPNILCLVK